MTGEREKLLIENGNRLNTLVEKAQAILAACIEPEGLTHKEAINQLLGLLDGPEQREAQKGWAAAIER